MGKHNQINKQLRIDDSQLPSDFSWQKMKGGIQSKIDTIESTKLAEVRPTASRNLGYLLLLFGVMSLVGGYIYLHTQGKSQISGQTSAPSIETQTQTHIQTHTQRIDNSQTDAKQEIKASKALTTIQLKNQVNTQSKTAIGQEQSQVTQLTAIESTQHFSKVVASHSKTINHQTATNKKENTTSATMGIETHTYTQVNAQTNTLGKSKADPADTPIVSDTQVSDRTSAQQRQATATDYDKQQSTKKNTATKPSQIALTTESNLKKATDLNSGHIDTTPPMESPQAKSMISETTDNNVSTVDPSTDLGDPDEVTPEPIRPKKGIKLIALAGSNLSSHNYKGSDLAIKRNDSNSIIIGQSAQLRVDIPLRKRWSLSTGIGYDRALTKLDYSGRIDTVVTANVITHSTNNASGTTTTTHESTDQMTSFQRVAQLYNNTHSITVPILLQRSIGLGNLSLNIGAGLEYRYITQRKVSYITEPNFPSGDYQLADYGSNDPFLSHILNTIASLSVDYTVKSGIGIGIGLDGGYSLNDFSNETDTQSHPMILRGAIRLSKQF